MSQAMEKQEQKILEKAAEKELIKEVYASEGLKKAPVKENRALAKRVLAAAVALSILVLGPIKLNSKKNSVLNEFKNGTESTYTLSVYNVINDAAKYADNMLSGIEGGVVSESKLQSLRALIDQIKSETDEGALIKEYESLLTLSRDVYDDYKDKGANVTSVNNSYRAITTTQTEINNLPYWQSAASYNSARGGFPANLMGSVLGIGYVPDKSGH